MNQVKELNDFADLLSYVKMSIDENPEDFPHYNKKAPRSLRKVPCTGFRTQDRWSGAWEFECGYYAEIECSECCCEGGNLDPRLLTIRDNIKHNKKLEIINRRFSHRK